MSISMGIKEVKIIILASLSSKLVMMEPVKVALTIKSSNQGIRDFQVASTPVFRYVRSVGTMAFIF